MMYNTSQNNKLNFGSFNTLKTLKGHFGAKDVYRQMSCQGIIRLNLLPSLDCKNKPLRYLRKEEKVTVKVINKQKKSEKKLINN